MNRSFIFDPNFWVAAFERAIKSLAQGLLVAGLGDGAGLLALDWISVLSIAFGMFLASLLTSIASGGLTSAPSLVTAEVLKTDIAAVGYPHSPTGYIAEEAAPVEEGMPVEVEQFPQDDGY